MAELWDSVKRFLALRLEIEMFMNEKGKVVAQFSDEKWLWDLVLLCDISHHVNYLTTQLHSQQNLISDMFEAVRALRKSMCIFKNPFSTTVNVATEN
jgi:hypothetical protein